MSNAQAPDDASAAVFDSRMAKVQGNPTDEELAIVAAIVSSLVVSAAEEPAIVVEPRDLRMRWNRATRAPRPFVRPGNPAWGGFSTR